jgi:hypothetical protein
MMEALARLYDEQAKELESEGALSLPSCASTPVMP